MKAANSDSAKVAIVTGAASGIGFAIAERLVRDGCRVIVNDLDAQALDKALDVLQGIGGACVAVPGNAGDIDVIDQLVSTAVHRFGQLDWVVANAGITTFGAFLDYTPAQFQQLVDLNLRGSFFLAQRAARQLVAQERGGRILLMSSVTGIQHHPDLAAYGMSKAAIRMLAKSLGAELAPHGITVNALAPGATQTERTLEDASYSSTWAALTPTGRPGTAQDVAEAAAFLLSDQAQQITAQTLVIDGGWTAVSPPPPAD